MHPGSANTCRRHLFMLWIALNSTNKHLTLTRTTCKASESALALYSRRSILLRNGIAVTLILAIGSRAPGRSYAHHPMCRSPSLSI
ncbi:hypothetical protein K474DRAFT_874655 [Panus rudis PR-1116 ss-1]|nr:hypothetical protein K474DRAFT_874655 [Panus rudis PR-1116 ss-1]